MKLILSKSQFYLPVILVLVSLLLVAADMPEKAGCPVAVQMGEVNIRIPAGETMGTSSLQFVRCGDMNVQVTGGTMIQTPVIVNAVAHHDWLIVSAYLQRAQDGPVDVTVWWRVD